VDFLTLDMETYYASDYTLSSMTTEAYVRDPRFEEILCSFKFNDTKAFWLLPDRAAAFIQGEINWANTILCCHHSHFDGLILSHHHGVKPAMHIDTLSMARVLDGPKAGHRLEVLAPRHGFGEKGDAVHWAKGKHLQDFSGLEIREYGAYGINDVELTYKLAQLFLEQMPAEELQVIDMVIRCFTEPVFLGDEAKLRGAVTSERQRKIDMLRRLGLDCPHCYGAGCKKCDETGVDKKTLGSNDRLAELLRALGAEPGTKLGKPNPDGSPKRIYAFAKTDPAMQDLLEDEDEAVRLVAEARIAVKSSIIETRAERFADMASRGTMPVYISYGAAHTFRMGGGDKMNWLNISSKHNENRPELSVIASSVRAPPGHVIVSADSAQGEARICAWGAGQQDLIEAFAQGRDVYSEHASSVYGRPVDRKKNKADFIPGQIGKVQILGYGYGMGWAKSSAELLKGMLGAPPIQFKIEDMQTLGVDPTKFLNNPKKVQQVADMPSRLELNDRLIHCAVTNALVDRYRLKMDKIVAYWEIGNQVIDAMIEGREMWFGAHGVMHTAKDKLWMPNGLAMRYDGIERDETGQASYWNGRERVKVHGRLIIENVTQSLHYCIMARQLLDIRKYLRVVLTTYDDAVAIVPENAAEEALQFMCECLSTTPDWAPGLPLKGEGKIGNTLKGAS
jgi:DNA polymerase family A